MGFSQYDYPKITLSQLEKILLSRFEKEGFLTLKDLPQPALFKDMHKATERIIQAIKKDEKIILIGDYDVDGVVSTTIFKLFFDEINIPLQWIIPNRFKDGYGLSPTIVPQLKGYDLAITVDNGISAVAAAAMCKELGIDLIITDHHLLPPQLPEAYAIINQKQDACTFPYSDICGAQIAWYLVALLNRSLEKNIDMKPFLELVAIAIVADMMPLLHINRAIVQSGLNLLNNSDRPAICAFKEHLQRELFLTDDIGFQLAPILNSAGRMEDASMAVDFLMSSNIYDARVRLQKIIKCNEDRKKIEYEITQLAIEQVDKSDEIIVVQGKDWHEGVIGIVASRIARQFEKPAIIFSQNSKGELKGSGRSFGECDLFEITGECREYLSKFGGHQAAIGLSISSDSFSLFKEKINQSFESKNYNKALFDPEIVGEFDFAEISFDLMATLNRFEPYGQANPKPKFITQNVVILECDTIGKESNHRRFSFEHESTTLPGIQFNTNKSFSIGETVTIIYRVNENKFKGNTKLQLLIENIIRNNNN